MEKTAIENIDKKLFPKLRKFRKQFYFLQASIIDDQLC